MTTRGNKRSTNEDAIGNAIEGGEFTDAVEEKNRDVVGDVAASAVDGDSWCGDGEFGAANEFAMRFVDEFGRGGEAFRLPRGEDEKSFGKSPWTTPKAMRESGSSVATTLPATMTGQRPRRLDSPPSQEARGRWRGQFHVVLEISADNDTIGRRS